MGGRLVGGTRGSYVILVSLRRAPYHRRNAPRSAQAFP